MTETGFALARLIIAAQDVAGGLESGIPSRYVLARQLRDALEGVGVEHRASQAQALMAKAPIVALDDKVPLVLYFESREDAEGFAAIVKSVMTNPIEVRLPEQH